VDLAAVKLRSRAGAPISDEPPGMNKFFESKYHLQEENHWWFQARRHIIFNLLKTADRNSKMLEVGCSGGPLLQALNVSGFKNVEGIDISQSAIDLCKSKGIQDVFLIDATRTDFEDERFDIVIASDVLEHLQNEESALSEWHRILKPGGKLIVFVPAFAFLWSEHDEANDHYRRYSKSQLIRALEKAHFRIYRSSYWNFSLFFPTSLIRILQRILSKNKQTQRDQLIQLNALANTMVLYLVKTENLMLNVLNFPVGVSVFAVARKETTESGPASFLREHSVTR
jgi:ubiquinone/menaquinone biosynthesis C-methylase UbiE